jgi:hypothetical protein
MMLVPILRQLKSSQPQRMTITLSFWSGTFVMLMHRKRYPYPRPPCLSVLGHWHLVGESNTHNNIYSIIIDLRRSLDIQKESYLFRGASKIPSFCFLQERTVDRFAGTPSQEKSLAR